jgi:hemerythrin-like metal-binding protein
MEFIEWNDSFGVGNMLMDTHHRIFFDMVKEFADMADTSDFDAIKRRIDFLAEYTIMHLCAEEGLMEKAGYPDLESHRTLHEAFALKVLTMRDSYTRNPDSVPADKILSVMQDWFMHHILDSDKHYAPFVEKLQN